jgi:hypothetical protein
MRAGDELDDPEPIVKYIPGRLVADDGSIDGAAFLPRNPQDDYGSSVNILYFYSADSDAALLAIKSRFRLTPAKAAKFAETTPAAIKFAAAKLKRLSTLSVIYDPLPANERHQADDSHSLIKGLPLQGIMDELVNIHLGQLALRTYPAR